MPSEMLKSVAEALVAHCRSRTEDEGLRTLYDPEAVSVEAVAQPGAASRETRGLEGIKGKHVWFSANFEVHSESADGPFLHGDDRFAVIFSFDATHKQSGQRNAMTEVGIYTVSEAGKIVREEFFYTT